MKSLRDFSIRSLSLGLPFFLIGYFLITSVTFHRSLYYLLVVLPWLILAFSSARDALPRGRVLEVAFVVVVGYLFLRTLWPLEFIEANAWYFGKRLLFVVCFVMSVAIASHHAGAEKLDRFILVFCAVASVYAATVLVAYFWGRPVDYPGYRIQLHGLFLRLGFHGYLGEWDKFSLFQRLAFGGNDLDNPINTALVCGLTVLLAMWLRWGAVKRIGNLALVAILAPVLAVMFLSQSLGPITALIVSIMLALVVFREIPSYIKVAVIGMVVVFGAVAIYFSETNEYRDYRGSIYEACLADGSQAPVFGLGPLTGPSVLVSDKEFAHCHNVILDVFRMGGATGALLLLVLLGLAVHSAWRGGMQGRFWGVVLVYGILCLSSDGRFPLTRPMVFWLVLWMPLGIIFNLDRQRFGEPESNRGN